MVLVALDEPLLAEAAAELRSRFPAATFRAVGCTLGAPGYLDALAAATDDVDVQLVFNKRVGGARLALAPRSSSSAAPRPPPPPPLTRCRTPRRAARATC